VVRSRDAEFTERSRGGSQRSAAKDSMGWSSASEAMGRVESGTDGSRTVASGSYLAATAVPRAALTRIIARIAAGARP
jgi:hypothetical protein